ncbi:AMP-binding protein [Pigmentiphaga litoralis]|uniref:Fatty-acyl-CoA synthase n=1 Tax=Pigmentiphaga litoralis TaxID=516702 RepID=A0A7Y9IZM7_9BURK|nr:AMP-binding protein [Pigmentiphaga litoralis]NYE26514.1 fatty-acyl-CoA synthase [Pigmentiphaga litoralis]NYE86075.1 fatty-acyl-CoA synthase [Pigmentiphaga litoralis]
MIGAPVTLYQALRTTEKAYGAHEAFVCQDERLTWSQTLAGTRRIAAALHARGIRKGDHVGIMMGNGATWLQVFFACAAIGAVTVPVNTRFKTDELAFCLKQADVKLLVFVDSFLGIDFVDLLKAVEPAFDAQLPGQALPELTQAVMAGDGRAPAAAQRYADFLAAGDAAQVDVDALAEHVTPDDILLMQFTSGTTSFPKGVMLTHANMVTNAWAAGQRIGVRADDRYFSIRPFFHVSGTTLSVLVSLVYGCCLLTLPKFDVAETLRILDEERCTLTSGNDTIFLMMMGHPDFDRNKLHLRGGWAAAGPEVMQQIQDVMGVPNVCNAYGQSEASPNVVLSDRNDAFELRAAGWGLPHKGTQVRIADAETGVEPPRGERGEIQVKGWHVMRGYYKMPDATAKAFTPDGWLKTGDLGEMSEDGRIRMVGRLKDMYRVGGENVAPAEVEETLHAHPAVQQAQVIGVPDARLGEVTAAFVLLKAGKTASSQELIDWCKGRCANFKVPRYLEVVDTFENIGMTGSSKVQKNKLRDHAIVLFGLGSGGKP